MGIVIIVLKTLILVKLRAIHQQPQPAGALVSREKKFKQNPVNFDLNPYYVIIAGALFIGQLKINLTLTISVAAERLMALSFPVVIRDLYFCSYATFCLFVGFLLGVFDVILELSFSKLNRTPGCGVVRCFLDVKFRFY
ncbi:unnamed protein product [Angiostrongylus costaricensis]|uniref:Uncharacterized protein n=1 Tax=Angiostrongylus costaricensis TaxID=334426 RepID=A0A158PFI8_ANGCS|nr:unnamed protein product [Angiostrongylus costaricensis]